MSECLTGSKEKAQQLRVLPFQRAQAWCPTPTPTLWLTNLSNDRSRGPDAIFSPLWTPSTKIVHIDIDIEIYRCIYIYIYICRQNFHITFYFVFIFIFILCSWVYTWMHVHALPTDTIRLPWKRSYRWLWAIIRVLGAYPLSSRRSIRAFNHWATSPSPRPF